MALHDGRTAPLEAVPPATARIRPLRVALVNDDESIVRGLDAMLAPFDDRIEIVEHDVGGIPDHVVDFALFDTFAGRRAAIDRAAAMAADGKVADVVLSTWDAPAEFLDVACQAGVSAVISKSTDGVAHVDALERVDAGERIGLDHVTRGGGSDRNDPLSAREREVLAMLALGFTNAEIAREPFLSVDTVKTYVRRVFQKLGVNNRTPAALLAQQYDLAPPAARLERLRGGRGSQ